MEQQQIIAKAQSYITAEQDRYFREQVEKLLTEKNFVELSDRFFCDLAFGTGGLRGVIGGGFNRMNPYVVQRATQGLANYINKAVGKGNGSAVIAYDSRNFSDLFALEAARVFCGNGIKTWLFSSLRPTPELSFAVRQLGATAGIVVTASHNPAKYNGYKVYWSDGAQIVAPHDKGIIDEVRSFTGAPHSMSREEAVAQGLLRVVDEEVDAPFIAMVKGCALRPALVQEQGHTLKVVYTPLNGAGAVPVERALRELGIAVHFVPEQREPDGNFPTTPFPNPEEETAMRMALDLGAALKADLVLGTDPDADRLGIAAPDGGVLKLVTGNQLGALLADYIFSTRKELGTLPEKPAFVKTIVTTEFQRLIAESYGALCFDTLTGFKYIGEKIREFELQQDGPQYIVGGEESYGYLVNTAVRDKDAVSAATLTAEMTLYHRSQGRTLFEQLALLWQRFGYFQEVLIAKTFEGQSGVATMQALMEKLRVGPPTVIGGLDVAAIKDYQQKTTRDMKTGIVKKDIELPASNVLQFKLADGSMITVRPSGTEPKIKFYASCCSARGVALPEAKAAVQSKIGAIKVALNELTRGV